MREPNTSRALQGAAIQAWRNLSDLDRDRSARYADTNDHASSGAASPRSGRAGRACNWVAALYRCEAFWRTHAHAPRENTRDHKALPAGERRMGEWARYQRRVEERLYLYCTRHFEVTGMLTRLNSNSQTEFALARWLARQLRHYQRGTLPKPRRGPAR